MPESRAPSDVNVLLVAEEAVGVQTLRAITRARHRIAGVVTSEAGGPPRAATVRSVAEQLGCTMWPAYAVRDPAFAAAVRAAAVDVLLNVHSLHVIHPAVLAAPAVGSFNLHPGSLPEYAGLNSPSWAIYNGESRHAVTVHWMTPEIDCGPIAYREDIATAENDTGLTLSAKCVKAGLPLLIRLLDTARHDPAAIPRIPQDFTRRRYHGKEVPEDGRLRWLQPAQAIERFVRACDYFPWRSPWGHPRARLGDQPLSILKAFCTSRLGPARAGTVGEVEGSMAWVAAADGWLGVSRVEMSGRAVDAAEVLRPGLRLEDGS